MNSLEDIIRKLDQHQQHLFSIASATEQLTQSVQKLAEHQMRMQEQLDALSASSADPHSSSPGQ